MSWPYDYIIIGAGSAGCAIANRLAEDLALRILVIEAGPPDSSFMLRMPAGFANLGEKTPYNWRYETTPQKHCNDRRMYWPRGKTWGGSSSINAMLYVRGHASDYDHWRQLGNEGWSYDDVLPYFKKAEHNERGPSEFHGVDGPLNVADQITPLTINDNFIRACTQLGHQRNDDFNGVEQEGFGYYQVTQKERQRWSAASAYLRPAVERNRNNVHVISNALVERIILDQNRAMGVRYKQKDGRDEVARCSREIILAGGAEGQRYSLPNSRIMIHQVSGGFRGQQSDIEIQAREALYLRARTDEILKRFELTRTGYLLLTTLFLTRDNSRALGYLSRQLMVHPTTITLAVDQLEQRRLVARVLANGAHWPGDWVTPIAAVPHHRVRLPDQRRSSGPRGCGSGDSFWAKAIVRPRSR